MDKFIVQCHKVVKGCSLYTQVTAFSIKPTIFSSNFDFLKDRTTFEPRGLIITKIDTHILSGH
jgi:hypothetical protein